MLYDPEGRVVAATTRFIDLGDTQSYTYELSAPIPEEERGRVWSLDIQGGHPLSITGAEPRFATTRAAFFTLPH